MPSNPTSPFNTLWLVLVMVAICVAAYYATKFLSNRARVLARSKYLQVRDSLYIAKDKAIMLVEVGNKHYLLGVSNQSIQLLAALEDEDVVPLEVPESQGLNIQQLQGAYSRAGDWLKKFVNAPKNLDKARRQKRETSSRPSKEGYDQQDFDQMLRQIRERKERVEHKSDRSGDE